MNETATGELAAEEDRLGRETISPSLAHSYALGDGGIPAPLTRCSRSYNFEGESQSAWPERPAPESQALRAGRATRFSSCRCRRSPRRPDCR
jgi:hypothetical protein